MLALAGAPHLGVRQSCVGREGLTDARSNSTTATAALPTTMGKT